jgi:hypothetical protein
VQRDYLHPSMSNSSLGKALIEERLARAKEVVERTIVPG